VSIEIKQGPFADTDDGWTEAEAVMADLDLAEFAQGAVQMARRFATSDDDEAEEGAA